VADARHHSKTKQRQALIIFAAGSFAAGIILVAGCGGGSQIKVVTNTPAAEKPVVKDATREELLEKYNEMARSITTLNATVELKPVAGSKYSGVIEEYHEVKAFLLAKRPAYIRMIGQAPVVGTTVFDMTSDGQEFRVSIPSKNKFLAGPVEVERASNKPIENLRPQHLLDALLWPELRKEEVVLFEEFNEETARFYVLTVLRGGYQTEILRKIWFDRANLQVARLQLFGRHGLLLSDTRFADWQAVNAPATTGGGNSGAVAASPGQQFPHAIRIERPHDDYRLELQITKVTLNEEIPAERFKLEQPAGAELVRVGENAGEKTTGRDVQQ
jgi:outer membrane lipoprotein-sorting protein